jgi:viroplasmin and RNaseH domain-containing protein
MKEYRITTMVTMDVLASSESLAVKYALDEIHDYIGEREDTKYVKNLVVTGIAQTKDGEFMVFEQKRARV